MPSGPRPRLPADAMRISLEGTYGDATWANILHLQTINNGAPTVADMQTVLTDVADAFHGNVMPFFSSALELTQAKGVLILSGSTEQVGVVSTTLAGSETGVGMPASTAVALSWSISAYYRGGKPRTYVCGVTEDIVQTVRTIKAASGASIAAGAATFIDDVNAITTTSITAVELGTYSFASGNAWRGTPLFRAYTGVIVHDRLDSQRRRLGKE